MAHKIGKADFVEFDVQLTRDMTPVVYHDFGLLYKGFGLMTSLVDKLRHYGSFDTQNYLL